MGRAFGLLVIAATLILPGLAQAQTQVPSPIPPTTKLAWDHDGINTDRYLIIVDNNSPIIDVGKPTPVGQTYETAFPPLTPGQHTLVVCAENIAGRGCSQPFPVSVVVIPSAPASLRIVVR